MKYLEWLKTNPEKGYYWVKYQDCDEERIDEFTDWYDNAGNKETRFTEQPEEVLCAVHTSKDVDNIVNELLDLHKRNEDLQIENQELRYDLKKRSELLYDVYRKTTDPKVRNMIFDYCEFSNKEKTKLNSTMAAF